MTVLRRQVSPKSIERRENALNTINLAAQPIITSNLMVDAQNASVTNLCIHSLRQKGLCQEMRTPLPIHRQHFLLDSEMALVPLPYELSSVCYQ
jgi:hypothetical protein